MLLKFLTLLLIALAIAYLGLVLYAVLRSDTLIFPEVPASYSMGPDIIVLDSSDGEKIAAYHLPVSNAKALLLYCHGNGEDIGDVRPLMEQFQQQGVAVLAFDYPGYGLSTGKRTEAGCFAATEAAYNYALNALDYRPEQINVYGRSLGGGPACWLAARKEVGSVMLDGTFTSTFRVITERKLLPWDVFDNVAHLKKMTAPVLFIHGEQDITVPFSHAKKNFAAYQSEKEKLWVQDAGHNNLIETAGDRYWSTVLNFLTKHHTTDAP